VSKPHNRAQRQSNTDSEIYASQSRPSIHARPGPTGIGKGTKNASLARQLEQRQLEQQAQQDVETQKKAVLDKLNKI